MVANSLMFVMFYGIIRLNFSFLRNHIDSIISRLPADRWSNARAIAVQTSTSFHCFRTSAGNCALGYNGRFMQCRFIALDSVLPRKSGTFGFQKNVLKCLRKTAVRETTNLGP